MKFDMRVFFENMPREFNFHQNVSRIMGTLHKDQYTFLIVTRAILLRMRNVSNISYRENQNTYFNFNNFFSENRVVYDIMWKNTVDPDRPQIKTVRRMPFACSIPKAINTYLQYVILIAFTLQRWLKERASIFRFICMYVYIYKYIYK